MLYKPEELVNTALRFSVQTEKSFAKRMTPRQSFDHFQRTVDRKVLMNFQNEISVFKLIQCNVWTGRKIKKILVQLKISTLQRS